MSWVREMIEAGANRFQLFISGVLGGWHPEALFWRILLAALAIGALLLFMAVAYRLLRRIDAKLESWRGTRIPPIRVQTFEVISADRLTDMLKWLVRKSRLLVWLVGLYIFIPLILSLFPQTRGWSPAIWITSLRPSTGCSGVCSPSSPTWCSLPRSFWWCAMP